MTTINLKRTFLKQPERPVALAALGTLLASFTGSALLERMERHAAEIASPSARWNLRRGAESIV